MFNYGMKKGAIFFKVSLYSAYLLPDSPYYELNLILSMLSFLCIYKCS